MTITLYYVTQTHIERDKVYFSKPTKFPPRFIICHPDDLPELEKALDFIHLVHIRDWKPAHPIEEPPTLSTTTTSNIVTMFEESLKELEP